MSETLNRILAQMPDAITKAAPSMIGRMIEKMQGALARDAHLPQVSYCTLLLKVGADDVAREFVAGLADVAARKRQPKPPNALPSGFGMLLEPMNESDPSIGTMEESTKAFGRMVARATSLGVNGFEAFGKEYFLGPFREALLKARVDEPSVACLIPYACRALDGELVRVYERIEALSRTAS
jgi:hypothetical protein